VDCLYDRAVVASPAGVGLCHDRLYLSKKILSMYRYWAAAVVGLFLVEHVPGQDIVADTGVHLVSRQFSFTEGASVDKRGNVFFTDQPNNRIWEYDVHSRLSIFMDSAGRSNGMYFDRSGRLVTCADENDQLWAIGPDKKVQVLLRDVGGRRLNGPNDLWIDAGGGIYITDPYYQRSYWARTKPEMDGERVYYLPRVGTGNRNVAAGMESPEVRIVDSDLDKPNGIVGTPDGKYLYVADIGAGKTYKYRIGADGSLSARRLFVMQGSDGMTLDERGDVYLTGDGVTVFDTAGRKITHIAVPEPWTANLCFGGRDKKTLFITASAGLYTIRMRVRGVE
jgi:gluconolactonase